MARIVIHEEKAPVEIQVGKESRWICMCGLSKKKPFCDGSHAKVQNEENGKLYAYSKEGAGVEING
ncbi:MAG: CDGSH iron-sulfur domain-containing protein [Candidatus Aenigmarchaeota archaeon]|nr:CDGSH iron-sulfur domain-containing protein [Candidatus Aenigmarchaeota archaeon]